jgi:hypothetical protein
MISIRHFSANEENFYKIRKDRIEVVHDMIVNSKFQNMVTEKRLFYDLIEIQLCQARIILQHITNKKRQGPNEIEPELITAHLN